MINAFEKFKLSKELIKALDALEYKEPTGVQEKVIPEVLFNKDLIVKSQTGTGKTGAFVIPLCERVKCSNTFTYQRISYTNRWGC